MWKRLKHPNVANFLGFSSDSPPFPLVYPWMSNGNLSSYLREHPEVDRLSLVSDYPRAVVFFFFSTTLTLHRYQLLNVAEGLAYLHHYGVVHGNLSGVSSDPLIPWSKGLTTSQRNVLVDDDGVACVSEYGLEFVLREEASSNALPTNVRWTAPEVISAVSKNQRLSANDGKRADVYSFAMVMFEVRSRACLTLHHGGLLQTPDFDWDHSLPK